MVVTVEFIKVFLERVSDEFSDENFRIEERSESDHPPSIEVDISKLEHPGQSIAVKDLNIPETISLINDELKNATVVTITEMQEEIIETVEPEEGEEGEVEGETPEEGETPTEATPEEEKVTE